MWFEPDPQRSQTRRPARKARTPVVTVVALVISAVLVGCGGLSAPRPSADNIPPTVSAGPAPAPSTAAPLSPPDPEVVALADQMLLTAEGRAVFYSTQPQLADAAEIETACAGARDGGAGDSFTGGCFTGAAQRRDSDRIFVFRPSDDRLLESMVTVAAHELLHAVYARLDPGQRARVDLLVAEATARVPGDDAVHEQIEWSVGGAEVKRANEQFAYLGSQIALDAGFPAALEEVYGRYFSDRLALVDTHRRALAVIDDTLAAVDVAWADVAAHESDNARARAQLDADRGGYETALAAYSADVDRFNATAPEERGRWEVTLRPVDAQPVTMTWEASLDYRREELDSFRDDLEARASALSAAEADAANMRASAEQSRADAIALLRARNPNADISD